MRLLNRCASSLCSGMQEMNCPACPPRSRKRAHTCGLHTLRYSRKQSTAEYIVNRVKQLDEKSVEVNSTASTCYSPRLNSQCSHSCCYRPMGVDGFVFLDQAALQSRCADSLAMGGAGADTTPPDIDDLNKLSSPSHPTAGRLWLPCCEGHAQGVSYPAPMVGFRLCAI